MDIDLIYPPYRSTYQVGRFGVTSDSAANLGRHMALVLYVAAARHSARGINLQILRATIIPVLEDYKNGKVQMEDVKQACKVALGPNWEPSGDWKIWIDKMEGNA